MGISIGALLAGGYGKGARAGADAQREMETQDADVARRNALDAQNAGFRTQELGRLQEMADFQQSEAKRKQQQMELERQQLEAALVAKGMDKVTASAVSGDPATARTWLSQPKPDRPLTWRDNVAGDKGPEQVGVDAEGKVVSRLPQFQAPPKGMSEYERASLAQRERAMSRQGSGSSKPPTASELRTGSLLMMAEQANNGLREFGMKSAPSFLEKTKSRVGMDVGNLMTDDQFKRVNQYALQLSDAWLRYTSGAAVPESEVRRFATAFTPLPGDSSAILAQKARAREQMIRAMRKGAGRSTLDIEAEMQSPQAADLWPE